MSYTKQTHVAGQKLTAAQLNYMENGIVAAQNAYNLLDNSDFTNPVNQRGVTTLTASGNQYTIDRWRMDSGKTFTLNDGSITISGAWLMQFVPEAVKEKTYTMAACLEDGTIVAESATPLSKHRGTYFGIDYVSNNNRVYVGFIKAGTYRWAALYEGSYTVDTLPEYVPKGYAAELAECRRYYRAFSTIQFPVTCTVAGWIAVGVDYTGMRVTPSVSSYELAGVYINGTVYNAISSVGVRALPASELTATVSVSTAGLTGTIRFNSLALSADL